MQNELSNYEMQQIATQKRRLEAGSHVFTNLADESEWGWFNPNGADGWFAFVELVSAWNNGLSGGTRRHTAAANRKAAANE